MALDMGGGPAVGAFDDEANLSNVDKSKEDEEVAGGGR
jgi:hypothetical protein